MTGNPKLPAGVPWWQYAAKALVALGVGVVAAAGTITAAVADDHVTTSETWAIVIAVLTAVIGPVGVYAVRNRPTAREVAAHAPSTLYRDGGPVS
jgi:hypothetical protein